MVCPLFGNTKQWPFSNFSPSFYFLLLGGFRLSCYMTHMHTVTLSTDPSMLPTFMSLLSESLPFPWCNHSNRNSSSNWLCKMPLKVAGLNLQGRMTSFTGTAAMQSRPWIRVRARVRSPTWLTATGHCPGAHCILSWHRSHSACCRDGEGHLLPKKHFRYTLWFECL